jgi:hypothetical protein
MSCAHANVVISAKANEMKLLIIAFPSLSPLIEGFTAATTLANPGRLRRPPY